MFSNGGEEDAGGRNVQDLLLPYNRGDDANPLFNNPGVHDSHSREDGREQQEDEGQNHEDHEEGNQDPLVALCSLDILGLGGEGRQGRSS